MARPPSLAVRAGFFLFLTYALSAPFEYLVIRAGSMGAAGGLYALGGMWSPAIASLVTALVFRQKVGRFGWGWGKTRYQAWSAAIPFLYCLAGYGLVWALGVATFRPEGVIPALKALPLGYLLTCVAALGEEIGWSGFLVPQVAAERGFTAAALTRGLAWSAWHYPMIIAGVYANDTPVWYNLLFFTIQLTGGSFVYTWFRLRSGSLFTGMFLHASHNKFIQSFFSRLTGETDLSPYFIDEFGAALGLTSVLLAYAFWKRRESAGPLQS